MMEDYYHTRGYHVPAFGSWDWNNDMPFTQCFDNARQAAGLFRYSYSHEKDRDLYVAGDLYHNDVLTPAMIVVPRQKGKARRANVVKDGKKEGKWVVGDVKEPPSPPSPMARPTPKPVDEDLYKIPPELIFSKSKKKRGFSFFSSCFYPLCVT